MIVRINQIEASQSEQAAGWPQLGPTAAFSFVWPQDTGAFEIIILDVDEDGRPLALSIRQAQLRQLIPDVVGALARHDDAIVVRLDGLLAPGELMEALRHLTDEDGYGRYVISEARKLMDEPDGIYGSIRLAMTPRRLAELCADEHLGLERLVRMRVVALPQSLVNPMLDAAAPEDDRWPELLNSATFELDTTTAMQSIHILTQVYGPADIRTRLMDRLAGGARSAGASR